MSETDNTETETTETPEAPAEESATPTPSRRVGNPLSRPTDAVARPGFRNPSNKRSKAQKGSKKKRRK